MASPLPHVGIQSYIFAEVVETLKLQCS